MTARLVLSIIALLLSTAALVISVHNLKRQRDRRRDYYLECAYLQGFEDAVFKRKCDRTRGKKVTL